MDNAADHLLSVIDAARARGVVSRVDVLTYARGLGLQPDDIDVVAGRLQTEGLIEVSWAGDVAVTEKGQKRLRGPETGGVQINMGGGQFYAPGAGIGQGSTGHVHVGGDMVVGEGAQGRRVSRAGELDISALVLALTELQRLQRSDPLPSNAHAPAVELERAVQDVVTEATAPKPDTKKLEERLDRAKGVLDRLSGITGAAEKLGPALALLGPALHTALTWVQGFVH
jgi:hypothetical protein